MLLYWEMTLLLDSGLQRDSPSSFFYLPLNGLKRSVQPTAEAYGLTKTNVMPVSNNNGIVTYTHTFTHVTIFSFMKIQYISTVGTYIFMRYFGIPALNVLRIRISILYQLTLQQGHLPRLSLPLLCYFDDKA